MQALWEKAFSRVMRVLMVVTFELTFQMALPQQACLSKQAEACLLRMQGMQCTLSRSRGVVIGTKQSLELSCSIMA